MQLALSAAERAQLSPIEEKLSERALRPMSLKQLLEVWGSFVGDVETGYRMTIDDYTNDLCVRDLLQEVCHSVAPPLQRKLDAALGPLDARFKGATIPDKDRKLEQFIKVGDGWWWRRLPAKRTEELEPYLGSGRTTLRS